MISTIHWKDNRKDLNGIPLFRKTEKVKEILYRNTNGQKTKGRGSGERL